MKKYILAFITPALMLTGCNLVNVTDVQPVNQLEDENAITTVEKAQSALYGTYGILNGTGLAFTYYMPAAASLMGVTMKPGNDGDDYFINDPKSQHYWVENMYTSGYKLINMSNHIITKTSVLPGDDPRKTRIIGEAKFLRALGYFYLLRLYGEFYNEASTYGLVIRLTPVKDATAIPRSDVKATYEVILRDLDDAIKEAPDFRSTLYASKLSAMALKAKVLLYRKQYAAAAEMAKAVISSGQRKLESTFIQVFTKKIFQPEEAIFQTNFDLTSNLNNKGYAFNNWFAPADYYTQLMKGDKRDTFALKVRGTRILNNKFNYGNIDGKPSPADTEYFLRLAEIYLIQAEAIVRSGGTLEDARTALNKVRKRADMPDVELNDKQALLQAIREEKIKELGAESGEDWYDLVRFATLGELDIKTFKPDFMGKQRYILPLPYKSVQSAGGVVVQNPGY
ncbi:RagB/SusD family nutrient uptake outer membrane protein [Chitinophaga nivalis]|uniref:RagB/SusD family nutrient uptake outer membrane protein n=1 Tax=Chitinophaga nivalis TaxID=2991709 RepID=A0ABT3IRB7_9BACT|nr:RagB/SusD family nutrient uptake outer membrane protein [Chitinophaga nivalis]MCW3463798.1 RagB/SusD family nutrient uptake outer membrane protein [Chitinophaga nivalis]MCW3486512.1 RagB/SusD family nutrient uptake outer membrane protein [Chitinophaga nivalis]